MLVVQNRRFRKEFMVGGSGIFDSLLKFLVRTFTSQAAKKVASSAAKEVGKAALEVGKTVAADTKNKLIEKVMQTKAKNKIENIVSKYTGQSMKSIKFIISVAHCRLDFTINSRKNTSAMLNVNTTKITIVVTNVSRTKSKI